MSSRPMPRAFEASSPSERHLTRCAGLIPVASQDLDLHHTVMPETLRTSTPTEVLAGLVDRVTFHNSENGFCVLRVKARGQRDLITLVGHAAMISAGEFVQASGSWINDRTHGVQFKASFLKATAPTTVEGIEKYLGSGMIRGIGPDEVKTKRPSMWNIVLYNDDYTPMDFVEFVLKTVFHISTLDALALTLAVHTKGKGIAGTYTFDVAEEKQSEVLLMAKVEEHPLRVEVERV